MARRNPSTTADVVARRPVQRMRKSEVLRRMRDEAQERLKIAALASLVHLQHQAWLEPTLSDERLGRHARAAIAHLRVYQREVDLAYKAEEAFHAEADSTPSRQVPPGPRTYSTSHEVTHGY